VLAGSWTDTGWPATMEGAVRSGRVAAQAALAERLEAPARLAPLSVNGNGNGNGNGAGAHHELARGGRA
jgi:Flavin containing amine oxidoreductase